MRRRYHIHPPGLLYLVLVVLVGLAAANRPSNLLVWVFAAMLAGVLLSGILSGQPLMGLRAERSLPRTGRVGEPVIVRYTVINGCGRSLRSSCARCPTCAVPARSCSTWARASESPRRPRTGPSAAGRCASGAFAWRRCSRSGW